MLLKSFGPQEMDRETEKCRMREGGHRQTHLSCGAAMEEKGRGRTVVKHQSSEGLGAVKRSKNRPCRRFNTSMHDPPVHSLWLLPTAFAQFAAPPFWRISIFSKARFSVHSPTQFVLSLSTPEHQYFSISFSHSVSNLTFYPTIGRIA